MRGNRARVENADVRHPSSTVVMHRRKSASPDNNVLLQKHNRTKTANEATLAAFLCTKIMYTMSLFIL